jgi:hypothetical protein
MNFAPGFLLAQISFDIPFYLLFFLAALSSVLSYLMYRKIEGISKSKQFILFALRSISFFLLFLVVMNLTTEIIHSRTRKRNVFVIVDDSKSMSLSDGSVQRAKVVKSLVQSRSFQGLSKKFEVIPVLFGGDILKLNNLDSLKFDQPFTNIESALAEASRLGTNAQAAFAILITDGNYNEGGNPVDIVRSLSFPVYSVGVGDSTQPRDIVAREIIPAPSVYAGKKSVVRAVVSSFGFGGKSVAVQLLEDRKIIDSRNVTLTDEGNIELSFDYKPELVGTHILTVHVSPLKGEFDQRNNSTSVSVDVLKGKYSVLLVAGEPASDVAFLRRNIESDEDFNLRVLIQKDGDNFYLSTPDDKESNSDNPDEILSQKYDAVLLYDFPNPQSSETFSKIRRALNSTAYVYFAGKSFSSEEVSRLPRLPFAVREFSPGLPGGEFQVGISPVNSSEPSADLQPLYALINENSNLIPPLYYQRIECVPSSGGVSLAVPVLNGVRMSSPILLVSETGKSAAFLAYGLWRIQLMGSISGLRSDFLEDLLLTLVRNLINSGKQKLLTVGTDKKSYDPSETINFTSLLVGQTGSPVNDAVVDVNIRNESTKKFVSDVQLSRSGNGSYTGSATGLGEGKYSYYAQAKSSSGFLGADSGTMVVESLNKEFIQTAMNAQLLKQLASITGGQFLTPQEFIDGRLPIKPEWMEPVMLKSENRFELLSSLPILAVVFVLLGMEWSMRKIWGLP